MLDQNRCCSPANAARSRLNTCSIEREAAFFNRAQDVSFHPARYIGSSGQPLFAVVASDDGLAWEWKGIYEWNARDPLPEFSRKKYCLCESRPQVNCYE